MLSLKNDVNVRVPTGRNKKKTQMFCILKATAKKRRIRIWGRIPNLEYGSKDPDPCQHDTDSERCRCQFLSGLLVADCRVLAVGVRGLLLIECRLLFVLVVCWLSCIGC
jgi:hypothetical protein